MNVAKTHVVMVQDVLIWCTDTVVVRVLLASLVSIVKDVSTDFYHHFLLLILYMYFVTITQNNYF